MADIDQILAGGAGASTRADFSGIAKLPEYYWKGRDEAAKNAERDVFRDGVPKNADGTINYGAMRDALFKVGGIDKGLAADSLDIQRQRLKFGMDAAGQDFPTSGSPQQSSIISPPSTNRGASVPVAPPLNRGGQQQAPGPQAAGSPQGDQPGSIMGLISAAGVPDELAGPIMQQVSAITRTDPNAPVNPQQAPRVQQIIAEAVRRSQAQQQPQPQSASPQPPPAPPSPSVPDPTLGGIVPPGRTPQQQLDLMTRRVASGLLSPEVAKVYETRIKAIQDYLAPTPDMKNAAASGQSLPDYQNRTDENTTQRDILTKSLLPKLDASQEKATAARDDISSIHRARAELDRPGSVFSGSFAEQKQYLAKVASALGIADTEKIPNTEAYGAAIGQRVASMVKAFGSGTAISDGDRRFAAAMAGGNVTLDERSMRRILDIGEKAGRGKIAEHADLAKRIIGSNEGLKSAARAYEVAAPGAYVKPEQAAQPQFKDGQFAVNPKTKERIVFQGGKWVPAQ